MDAPTDDPAPPPSGPARWLEDAERIDVALYAAIAQTPTPALDRAMARLSRAADYSRLSLAAAAVLAATGGRQGRRAATMGLASVAVTSGLVNLGMKPLGRRRRPDRAARRVPVARHVRMPVLDIVPLRPLRRRVRVRDRRRPRAPARGDPAARTRRARRLLARAHRRPLSRATSSPAR